MSLTNRPKRNDLGGMWKDAAKRDTKNERWKAGTG